MKALVFSKDRPLQLDACLRSLALHAADPIDVEVVWKPTTARYRAAYVQVMDAHPAVRFSAETDFEADVRAALASAGEHVLFVVDDTVFVRRFSPQGCAVPMMHHPEVIGFSLRLGKNTRWCYPLAREQALPLYQVGVDFMAWDWRGEDADFGYPLELSSSIYRAADILAALDGVTFRNPNELEHTLSLRAPMFATGRPWLMAYETSVAFSIPCNRVQTMYANRAGLLPALTAEALLEAWEAGYGVDVEALAGHVPRAAHEEVAFRLVRRPYT